MSVEIAESGVVFGPFDEDDLYWIETCPAATALGAHIKRVEFIARLPAGDRHTFSFVEAKSSIPRSDPDLQTYWAALLEKRTHSLLIWSLGASGRHEDVHALLPAPMKPKDWSTRKIELLLIIPTIPDTHLPQVTDAFRRHVLGFQHARGIDISGVLVLNESRARAHGLIRPPVP